MRHWLLKQISAANSVRGQYRAEVLLGAGNFAPSPPRASPASAASRRNIAIGSGPQYQYQFVAEGEIQHSSRRLINQTEHKCT